MNDHRQKGTKVKHTEHTAKTPSDRTGLFAMLRALLPSEGSGAPSHRRQARAFSLALAIVSVALGLVASTASAVQSQVVFDFFGHTGSGAGQFAKGVEEPWDIFGRPGAFEPGPAGIAVNNDNGDVYIVDRLDNRVEQFEADHDFVRGFGVDVIPGGATGTGNLTNESTEVTSVVTNTKAFIVGQIVTGTGIPLGTTIVSVVNGAGAASKLVLSNKATATTSGVALTAAEGTGNLAQNERQTIALKATAGTYKLKFKTTMPTAEATTAATIAFNASAATVQGALESLANIGAGNVEVTGPNGGPYVAEFKGKYADTNVGLLESTSSTLTGPGTISIVTTQDGAARFEKCTLASTCQAGAATGINGGMNKPQGIAFHQGNDNLYVTDTGNLRVNQYDATGTFVRSWGANVVESGPDNKAETQSIKVAGTSGTFALSFGAPTNTTTVTGTGTYSSGSNEITLASTPVGVFTVGKQIAGAGIPNGTKITAVEPTKLTISNNTTEAKAATPIIGDLPYDAAPAVVEAALNALNTIGGVQGSVSVTGGPGNASGSSPYVVSFGGALGNVDNAQIALNANGLGQPESTVIPCTGGPTTEVPPANLSYEWLRNGVVIGGATSASYTLVAEDAGKAIQCKVKAANADGPSVKTNTPPTLASPAPVSPAPAPPAAGPTISVTTPSGGGLTVGNTLTCASGTWTPAIPASSFTFRWLRNGVEIGGATAATYVLQAADNQTAIQCEVKGINLGGATGVGISARSIIRSEPPANNGTAPTPPAPAISGTPAVGQELTCSTGTWTPAVGAAAPTFSYRWLRNGTEIGGATVNTYTLVAADESTAIQCKVIATAASGIAAAAVSANAVIAPVPSPTPPVRPSAAPTVTGTRNVGKELTCASSGWTPTPEPTVSYQWLRNGLPIAGATNAAYTLVAADLDKMVQCQAIGINAKGASVAISASAVGNATVINPPAATSAVTLVNPSTATTTLDGAAPEICEAATDTCRAGLSPESTKRLGGTFVSVEGINDRVQIAPGGPYAGDVFVSDGGGQRMQIFNPSTGAFVAMFGKEVLQSGTETNGKNVCIAALGNVCKGGAAVGGETGSPNTYGFSSQANEYKDARPATFAIDNTGAIYVPGKNTNFLQKYSPNLATEQDFAPEICTPSNGVVEGCTDVAIDPATNDVYIVHGIRGETEGCVGSLCFVSPIAKEFGMLRLDSTGTGAPIEKMLEEGGIQHIYGLAVDGSTGNERSGRVYFTTGTPEQRVDVLGLATPPDIVFNPIETADIGTHSVTVRGSIDPNGDAIDTSYQFETLIQGGVWKPFPAAPVNLGHGTSPVAIEQTITGLRANTKYKVRLVAIKGQRSLSPEQQITTLQAGPDVVTGDAKWSGPPSSSPSLTFSGTVDDNNLPVHYYFEYGTDTSYGARVPIFETGVHAAAQAAFLGRQTVNGLDPNGTYHYRIVGKTSSGTSFGADEEVGPSQAGGRFAELVSPANKGVGTVDKTLLGFVGQEDNQAAANGERLNYMFEYGAPDTTAGGEVLDQAIRGASGWTTVQLGPPSTVPPLVDGNFPTQGMPGSVRWMSPELDCGIVQSHGKVTPETPPADVENLIKHLYLRDVDGNFKMITPTPLNSIAQTGFSGDYFKVRGGASDCGRVIFNTGWKLLPGMPAETALHVYEWEDTGGSGTLRVVDILPNGAIPPAGGASTVGRTELNAVSQPDASRAFFIATSNEGGDIGKKAIFVRKNHSVTVDASQSQTAVANTGTTTYQMASSDGSHVFFIAMAGLASNSATTTGNSLYDYNVDSGVLRDLSPDSNPADTAGAAIDGVMGANDDGSYIYFGAKGQLVAGQGKTYAQNLSAKQDNVYLSHSGALSYVGAIKEADWSGNFIASNGNGGSGDTWLRGARITSDGKYLLFKSGLNLTSYDSHGTQQYYRYSVTGSVLDCISCLPGGPSPNGKDAVLLESEGVNQMADIYVSRAMTPDGSRVFFTALAYDESSGGTVTRARPFEWHNGTLTQLANEGYFVDASTDGEDLFIATKQPLVPADQDSANDIYDLRVNGGFSYFPPEPCDPLTENSCQGTPPAPPAPTADPASSTFSGPGNPPASKPKAPKKHHKKKHHKKAQKRAAKHNRGGAK